MNITSARVIAQKYHDLLAPHCHRIEIAGSIRRGKEEVKDIEIVAIAQPFEGGLFASGIADAMKGQRILRGKLEPHARYIQFALKDGINLDLFLCSAENWGWILALRTGSADFNTGILLPTLKRLGYTADGGHIWRGADAIPLREEHALFRMINLEWVDPKDR
jgi:DNA polymerase/3'-5' exonuclease PolX